MPIKKKIINLLWYVMAIGLSSLVPFVMLPILTKELSISGYGVLSLIETSILFVIPLVSFKVEAGIGVEYFKLSKKNFKIYVFNALVLSLLAFSVVFIVMNIFKSQLASFIDIAPNYILMLPIFALLRIVSSIMLTIFRSKQQPIKFFFLSATQTVFDFCLSYIFVVMLKNGIEGRLWGVYTALGLTTVYGLLYLYRKGYFQYCTLKYFKSVLLFNYPLAFHALAGVFIVMSGRYFLAYYYDSEVVGLYATAYQIAAVMLLLGTIINQVWAPQLYKHLRNNEFSTSQRYGRFISFFLVISAGIIFLLQDFFYTHLVDEKFHESKPFFVWLLMGFLFQSLYFVATNYLFFYKKTFLLAKVTVIVATISLLLNYYMIRKFSPIGIAYATAITWFILYVTIIFIIIKNKNRWASF